MYLLFWASSGVATTDGQRTEQGPTTPVALQAANGEARQTEIRELKPGQVIERELAGGEAHTYRIAFTAGQYLNVTVEQIGINVEAALADPKGEQIASLDWWWREGTESLWAAAESTGDYLLKVSAPSKPAETGKYRIKIAKLGEWQKASADERDYVTAHKNFGEGDKLLEQNTAESRRKAGEKYKEALALWRTLKDGDAEGHTQNGLGLVEYRLGNLKQAVEYLNQAILLFRASGNRFGEVDSVNTLCVVYAFSGEPQKAFETYSQALPPTPTMQRFLDVPPSNPFYAHIDELAVRQIPLGCGGGNYCPTANVTRAQMAVFLVRAFGL